jgi:hypothetical protein
MGDVMDWAKFKLRIRGARAIQVAINSHGYANLLKTPKKWIYPLPVEPAPAAGSFRQNFILVYEDMNAISVSKNKAKWKSAAMTRKLFKAIYEVVKEVGLIDCVYAFNMPFSTDGRVAFVDTEQ